MYSDEHTDFSGDIRDVPQVNLIERAKKKTGDARRYGRDYLTYLRYRRDYIQRHMFIAAIPKTASTWLAYAIAESVSGYRVIQPGIDRGYPAPQDFTEGKLRRLSRRLSVTRLHTPPNASNKKTLARLGKHIVLVRDLRDVVVSIYWHLRDEQRTEVFIDTGDHMELPWNRISSSDAMKPKEACIDALISVVLPGLSAMSMGWWKEDAQNPCVLLVKYEELAQDPAATLLKAIRFHQIAPEYEQVNVDKALNRRLIPGERKYRRGVVGGWQDDLSLEQARRCNDVGMEFQLAAGYV